MGILLGNARFHKSADQAASCAADGCTGHCAGHGRRKPTRSNDWPETGDRQHAEPGREPRAAAQQCARRGACRCAIAGVVVCIAGIVFGSLLRVALVAGHDADILAVHPHPVKFVDGADGVFSALEKSDDIAFHVRFLVWKVSWQSRCPDSRW